MSKSKEQKYSEIIQGVKSVEIKKKYHRDDKIEIEQNAPIHTDLDFKAGIDRTLICSHCRYRVIDCMGKCENVKKLMVDVKEDKKIKLKEKFAKFISNFKP